MGSPKVSLPTLMTLLYLMMVKTSLGELVGTRRTIYYIEIQLLSVLQL